MPESQTGMHLLLIDDDDDDDVLFFAEALQDIYPVATLQRFESAEKALLEMDQQKINKPDLIFIDVNLPVVDGWECLRRIKSMAGWQRIPLIMYSSADLKGSGVQPADVGAVAFYQKSDSFDELKLRLKQVISSILPLPR